MKQQAITGKNNEQIKHLKKLGIKKYREEFMEFLVENATILLDALRSGYKPTSLFVTQEFIEHNTDRWTEIGAGCGLDEYYLIDEQINKAFSELETPAGVGAVFDICGTDRRKPVNFDKLTLINPERIVYLNAISDPGNLGTILRSALAFGIKTIVLDAECVDVYNPKTIQAARDAIFKINLTFDDSGRTVLKQIKKQMPIYATALNAKLGIEELKKTDAFCLILGNETSGISSDIRELTDKLVKIKISDQIESLNVAVAAGIIFYQIYLDKS